MNSDLYLLITLFNPHVKILETAFVQCDFNEVPFIEKDNDVDSCIRYFKEPAVIRWVKDLLLSDDNNFDEFTIVKIERVTHRIN